jgi:hypothetical protein
MRPILRASPAALVLLLALAWSPLGAQQRDSASRLSPVARGAVESYNAPGTMRVSGALDVAANKVIIGDVAALNGPVTVLGEIQGSLVAINADVRLARGARISQNLVVIGGTITGKDSAQIGGEIRLQAELLRYHLDGDRLVADDEPSYDDAWWKSHRLRAGFRRGEAYTDFFYVASRAYNRVEGLSFVIGPRFHRLPSWGEINVEAFGVVRTAGPRQWDNGTLGHQARAEVQFGRPIGVSAGARAFDVVEPTESWQLNNQEAGLSSFLFHRDYRDYYGRHGGEAFVGLHDGRTAELALAFSDEQWLDRRERDPWTLFRNGDAWPPNPRMDVGGMHLLTARLRVDTRDREGSQWLAGWFAVAEIERGAGTLTRLGAPVATFAPMGPEAVDYRRGFIDLRRYNRISPDASLNLRLVGAGWVGGDPLPTQRKVSLGGAGSLPGYGFRETGFTPDVLQCSNGFVQAGTPAQCDRVLLAQVELRSHLLAGALRDDGPDDWWRPGFNHTAQWVLFADGGRGWRVGGGSGADPSYDGLPALNTFKVDLGAGVDFGGFGLYVAKAVSDGGAPARFFVRLDRRF